MTPHGIARACFKTWASEETNVERDVIEACLTHAIGDELEAAYRRSDFYAKRTRLMAAWADSVLGRQQCRCAVGLIAQRRNDGALAATQTRGPPFRRTYLASPATEKLAAPCCKGGEVLKQNTGFVRLMPMIGGSQRFDDSASG